jgi:uncharacterized protein DUF669
MTDELPETFDPGAHSSTDCVPPGWYSAHVIEATVCDARNGNGTYLLAVFEILAGEYKNRKIFQNVTLQNASQQAVEIGARLLKDMYEAIGHAGPTRSTGILLYKPVMARVGIKRDNDGVYDDRNCISKVKGPDYQPKGVSGLSKTSPVPPKGPVTPPTSAGPGSSGPGSSGGSAPWR